ncbi:MAG TPA: hypothetical protein VJ385_04250, partial [Fibrobacteria bacterium]|nr:hypothetical protein [Fibrobacteria bacterium]
IIRSHPASSKHGRGLSAWGGINTVEKGTESAGSEEWDLDAARARELTEDARSITDWVLNDNVARPAAGGFQDVKFFKVKPVGAGLIDSLTRPHRIHGHLPRHHPGFPGWSLRTCPGAS